ncbi:alpha/beta hydrolase [Flammeovirgaceae bacterium SG7u.111]|nr:alpha/beta hydrolase [Flammeovirgaceae bacterium SG7u.132]WPO36869.1 alpha/beta hydrolase [Flammeovirgaceae bacterium SG7u.111]
MQTFNSRLFFFYLWLGKIINGRKQQPIAERRKSVDSVKPDTALEGAYKLEKVSAKGLLCYWIKPEEVEGNRVVFYLHGGGYNSGSFYSHQNLVGWLGKFSKAQVLFPEYRLAPEYPFPTAIEDALSAYEWLLKQHPDKEIVLAGDSAGGGLAMAMLLAAREENLPMPKAMYLMAPWADLTMSEPDIAAYRWKDPILTVKGLAQSAKQYAAGNNLKLPFISPYFGEYDGFPPTLIQVGTHDLFLPECRTIKAKLDKKGIPCEMNVWPGMVHGWQVHTSKFPEAKAALQKGADFLLKYFS